MADYWFSRMRPSKNLGGGLDRGAEWEKKVPSKEKAEPT